MNTISNIVKWWRRVKHMALATACDKGRHDYFVRMEEEKTKQSALPRRYHMKQCSICGESWKIDAKEYDQFDRIS